MTDRTPATVEQIRDYLDMMVKGGKGHYCLEVREHYLCFLPETLAVSDDERLVFLGGIY